MLETYGGGTDNQCEGLKSTKCDDCNTEKEMEMISHVPRHGDELHRIIIGKTIEGRKTDKCIHIAIKKKGCRG